MEREARGKESPLAIIALFLAALVILALALWETDKSAPEDGKASLGADEELAENGNAITIPGYETLTLKADMEEQGFSLSNPAQNTCCFRITLTLSDGTELWQSELIAPGEISEPVVLKQSLESGCYPKAILRYDCYPMDPEQTPRNGAEMKLTLWVQ